MHMGRNTGGGFRGGGHASPERVQYVTIVGEQTQPRVSSGGLYSVAHLLATHPY